MNASLRSRIVALLLGGCLLTAACKQKSQWQPTPSASASTLLLAGTFTTVARAAQGTAEIVKQGEQYQLRLHDVRVESKHPVRVYLVGADRAPTTRSVADAKLQYDMAELDQGAAEQIIALPSEPDPSLRSVVLWEPRYYVNLAFASLRAPRP